MAGFNTGPPRSVSVAEVVQHQFAAQFTQMRGPAPLIVDDRHMLSHLTSSFDMTQRTFVNRNMPPQVSSSYGQSQVMFHNRYTSTSSNSTTSSGMAQINFDNQNIRSQSTHGNEMTQGMVDSRNVPSNASFAYGMTQMANNCRNMPSQSTPRMAQDTVGMPSQSTPRMVQGTVGMPSQSTPRMTQGTVGMPSQSTPRMTQGTVGMPSQSTPRYGMTHGMIDSRNVFPQFPPRIDIVPITAKTLLPRLPRRRGMGTLMLENRDLPPMSPPTQGIIPQMLMPISPVCIPGQWRHNGPGNIREWQLLFERYFEQVRLGAKNEVSFISSIIQSLAINDVGFNNYNSLHVAVREYQTLRPSTLHQPHQLCPTLETEIRSLFLLNLMFSLHVPIEALRPKPIIWNYDEEKEMSSKEVIEIFWITGLPKAERPRLGVAVCLIEGDPVPKRFVSDHEIHAHAESTMIDYLRRVLISERVKGTSTPGQIAQIEVFQNYSPCGECSVKYCRLLGEFADHGICVKITIHFVSMYRIYWDMTQSMPTLDWLPLDVHCRNRDGLLRLMTAGVEMYPFTIFIWQKLLTVLGLTIGWNIMKLYIECGRRNVDHKTAERFKRCLEYAASCSI